MTYSPNDSESVTCKTRILSKTNLDSYTLFSRDRIILGLLQCVDTFIIHVSQVVIAKMPDYLTHVLWVKTTGANPSIHQPTGRRTENHSSYPRVWRLNRNHWVFWGQVGQYPHVLLLKSQWLCTENLQTLGRSEIDWIKWILCKPLLNSPTPHLAGANPKSSKRSSWRGNCGNSGTSWESYSRSWNKLIPKKMYSNDPRRWSEFAGIDFSIIFGGWSNQFNKVALSWWSNPKFQHQKTII